MLFSQHNFYTFIFGYLYLANSFTTWFKLIVYRSLMYVHVTILISSDYYLHLHCTMRLSLCQTNRPLALRGHVTSFSMKMKVTWFCLQNTISGSCLKQNIIKYLRQYAHSHWSIGVFRWEYANTVVTSRFLCFPGTIWNHFKAGSSTLKYKY